MSNPIPSKPSKKVSEPGEKYGGGKKASSNGGKSGGQGAFNRNAGPQDEDQNLQKFSFGAPGGGLDSLEMEDDGEKFDQFAHNAQKFGYKSSFKETYYTTKLDEQNFTEEQKKRAARLEREIENKGKIKNYNEDGDEEMDTKKFDKNYDNFVQEHKVINFEEIEAKQLSNKDMTKGISTPLTHKEMSKEDLMKKESFNSANDFELDDPEQSVKLPETTSEGSCDESQTSKSGMKINSKLFTPKNQKPSGSNKSIEEFEFSTVGKDEGKETGGTGLKKTGLKLRNKGREFVPTKAAPVAAKTVQQPGSALSKTAQPNSFNYQQPSKTFTPYQNQSFQPPSYQQPQQPSFQQHSQSWQNQAPGQPGGNFKPSQYPNNTFSKPEKKTFYYKIKPLVTLEEMFSFDAFYHDQTRNEHINKIEAKKEENRNKIKDNPRQNTYNKYGSSRPPYQGGFNSSTRGKPGMKSYQPRPPQESIKSSYGQYNPVPGTIPQNPGFAVAPGPPGGGATYSAGGGSYSYQGGGMQGYAPPNTGPPIGGNLPPNIGQKSSLANSTTAPAFDPGAKSFKPSSKMSISSRTFSKPKD